MRKFYLPPRHITDISPSADDIAVNKGDFNSINGANDKETINGSVDSRQNIADGDKFELTVEQALKEYYEYVNSRNK